MAHGTHSGPGIYIVVALILGVITYVEYYIVEFPPVWLSPGWILFWLVVLSLAKFWMVIWFFMHLRNDDKLYTGFFASGMVIALGTFVALAAMFLLPRAVRPVIAAGQPPAVADHGDPHADPHVDPLGEDLRALIETDGESRSLAARTSAPRPKDQSIRIAPPPAPEDGFSLRAEAAPAEELEVADDPDADAAAAAEPSPEEVEADAPTLAQAADPTFDTELGAQVYAQSCVGCHQANGQGIPGAFPPLAGHAADVYEVDGGRTLLVDIVLYGMQGPITVEGQTYNGLMPPWQQLSDEQVAAVVNHVVAGWEGHDAPDGFDAIRPEEVADERGKGLTPAAVHELRGSLGLE